ncbi:SAM domain-containing protein [Pandoraea sputorum]|uniref:hypothetical protein n=1 Tax=Pandoraea sputorum TaxID=93222 RepID=UPI001241593F|nr:hypothetical protein [Pandoraea sputorum]VVE56226.1 hypothetical protein PSP20601_05051 [Pandoraea sputorum]
MRKSPQSVQPLLQEVNKQAHVIQTLMNNIEGLQQELVQLQERAKTDPQARARLERVQYALNHGELAAVFHRLSVWADALEQHLKTAPKQLSSPTAATPDTPAPARKSGAKSGRTFV